MSTSSRWARRVGAACTLAALTSVERAEAAAAEAQATPPPVEERRPGRAAPEVDAHIGMVVPIVILANKTTAIGSDFAAVGLASGITVHLGEDWAVDFELVAQNEFMNNQSRTTVTVDPGVLRRVDGFTVGLRIATQVGGRANVGLVPIAVVPMRLSKQVSYFVGGGFPVVLRDDGTKLRPSVGFQVQTGLRF